MKRQRGTMSMAVVAGLVLTMVVSASEQYVETRLQLGTNLLVVGETTTLQAFARIVASQWTNTDRIFSWYVDLTNSAGSVVGISATNLTKPTSDKDPRTSSYGFIDGPNVRGVFDTFMNRPNAGRSNWVELFSVPVVARAVGQATLRVVPGTGVPGLSADFIVAPLGGGNPLIGGIYTLAQTPLTVVSDPQGLRLSIAQETIGPQQYRVSLTFGPRPGWKHYVEYRDFLGSGSWQTLPFGPHDSGSVTATNAIRQRFYRVRLTL